jgi:hypothetical protein
LTRSNFQTFQIPPSQLAHIMADDPAVIGR